MKGSDLINRKDLPEANTTCKICGHKYYMCTKCLKLKRMGIESWRQHCDCVECYQIYSILQMDPKDVSMEEYEHITSIDLPDGHELTDEVEKKLERHLTAIKRNLNGGTNQSSVEKSEVKEVQEPVAKRTVFETADTYSQASQAQPYNKYNKRRDNRGNRNNRGNRYTYFREETT